MQEEPPTARNMHIDLLAAEQVQQESLPLLLSLHLVDAHPIRRLAEVAALPPQGEVELRHVLRQRLHGPRMVGDLRIDRHAACQLQQAPVLLGAVQASATLGQCAQVALRACHWFEVLQNRLEPGLRQFADRRHIFVERLIAQCIRRISFRWLATGGRAVIWPIGDGQRSLCTTAASAAAALHQLAAADPEGDVQIGSDMTVFWKAVSPFLGAIVAIGERQ